MYYIFILLTDVPIKVTVILPSEDKHGKLNQIHYKIKNQASLDSIMRQIKGHLSVGGLEALLEFSELQDGCTYQVISAHWTAIASGVKRNQIEDKVLEANSCLAVANPLSKENNFHLHSNVKFQKSNGQDEVVIDGVVVHTGGENTPSSSAYIISCTLSPQPKDIDSVLQQVELFKKHSPHHSHFKSVASNRVYPVLAGKFWSDVTINTLRMSPVPILCVMPSGLGYQVCKSFSTMIRRVV